MGGGKKKHINHYFHLELQDLTTYHKVFPRAAIGEEKSVLADLERSIIKKDKYWGTWVAH